MSDNWTYGLFEFGPLIIVVYVFMVMGFYLFLFAIAARKLRSETNIHKVHYDELLQSSFSPPLSILVPAYNEELNIVESVRSLLGINYSGYEIIVINDGSKDRTKEKILAEFDMYAIRHQVLWSGLKKDTKPILGVYRSRKHPSLFFLDKENGGKADALNAGINFSHYPYFVSLDGDTVLDTDAFLKIMKPIVEARPGEEIIGSGGSVGIANGSLIDQGHLGIEDVRLSSKPIVIMQVIEYLRAFLMGRIGLSQYNMLLIVSGAFGVFRKDWVLEAGGYEVGTIGEDMELIVRLHRLIREKKSKAKIAYIPDPVCWTEAPETLSILKRQRVRWQRGLFESLWNHRKMILNPRFGRVGLVAMPYFLFVELLGPVVEALGYMILAAGLISGQMDILFSFLLMLSMLLYGSFLSMGSVLLEDWTLNKYKRISDVTKLFVWALSESFWYRPVQTLWRLEGLFKAVRGKKHEWGEMTRKGIFVETLKK
ncbi:MULTISPECIES: glycosyltransferase [unclassified Paenibacillus]|uniref:glycosyltransferase family 2 protein n=1 Tax=unclassified Paenibacillus TaxID=185978 RepID=UPI001AE95B10|nr:MULTISPECIES: glycosyltransferase [unclassified Paenibacillus]MBP1154931.1 cellulose synthase/poly-beta-1,6-N-acetylglucosamine synthase-like glycosyltransferase [Paenibacillus sp. PvP091]MBP1169685.1 cellulose synthase/poly-beta-1,6-N-acetylglucosamine synthase-like glycosyltransferase [Paenibacillus sp. PvR098]MBP2440713.1 cellulose synthase/poly-beta-1,6-N-acetylglucosamine synthase-like glycosyltransferase [Paenibacillus sp. PvP052]